MAELQPDVHSPASATSWIERILNPLAIRGDRAVPFRPLLIVLLALLCGRGAMAMVSRLPLQDPIDVVGRPLTDGYSEKAEHLAFYAFLVAAALSAVVGKRVVDRIPSALLGVLFAGLLWCWLLLELWDRQLLFLLLVLLGALGWLAKSIRVPEQRSILAWLLPVFAWGWTLQEAPLPLVEISEWFIWPVMAMAAAVGLALHLWPQQTNNIWTWLAPLTACTMAVVNLLLPWQLIAPSLLGVCAVLAGADEYSRRTALNQTARFPWLTLLAVGVLAQLLRISVYEWTFVRATVNASMIGWMLLIAQSTAVSVNRQKLPSTIRNWGMLLVAGVALVCLWEFCSWFGILTLATLLGIWLTSGRFRRNANGIWLVALLIAIAGIPHLGWETTLDRFHDGQQLSAVWEFEQGRTLYSEVFPLRAAGFWGVWLSWKVLPSVLANAYFFEELSASLLMVGGCLVGFAWTRSAAWGMATGLLVSPWFGGASAELREGLFLCLLGTTMLALSSTAKRRWLWCGPAGATALLGGFDIAAAIIAPTTAAVCLSRLPPRGGLPFTRALITGIARSIWVGALPLLLFSMFVGWWQGLSAVTAYWNVFLEEGRYLNAAFGNPIAPMRQNPQLFWGLTGLGVFTAGCAMNWNQFSESRRRVALLILCSFALYAHRVLGRSDQPHLNQLTCLTWILWLFNLFGYLRLLAHGNLWSRKIRMQQVGLGAAALLAWQIRSGPSNPIAFIAEFRGAPTHENVVPPPVPEILSRLPPGTYLWPVEDGIANYQYQRANPTRHAIAFSIGAPSEERLATENLKRLPTPVILWDWAAVDGIDGLLRHYPIAMWVLRTYRPVLDTIADGVPLFAVPADSSWIGVDQLPEEFLPVQYLGLLASTWGEQRWPRLQDRVLNQKELRGRIYPKERHNWEWSGSTTPRSFNYLLLTMTATEYTGSQNSQRTAELRFGPDTELEEHPQMTFQIHTDGKQHDYLIPIGCHPGWTWRPQIRRLQISAPAGVSLSLQSAQLYDIDEWSTGKAQQK